MWGMLAMMGIGVLLAVGGISIMSQPLLTLGIFALIIVFKHAD